MSPVGSWIEWFDHGNIDHYDLFNIRYLVAPADLWSTDRRHNENDNNNNNNRPRFLSKISTVGASGKYVLYQVSKNITSDRRGSTSGYSLVAKGCENDDVSLKYMKCLHPMLHDARPGRGYGRQSERVKRVDPEWMYLEEDHPDRGRRLPLMSLAQMNQRKRENLPISRQHLTLIGTLMEENMHDDGGKYEATVRVVRAEKERKEEVEEGKEEEEEGKEEDELEHAAVVVKINYHPHWICSLNGTRIKTYRVAPGYIAMKVGDVSKEKTGKGEGVQVGEIKVVCEYLVPRYKKILMMCPLMFVTYFLWSIVKC